jgi:hypothetical protein
VEEESSKSKISKSTGRSVLEHEEPSIIEDKLTTRLFDESQIIEAEKPDKQVEN